MYLDREPDINVQAKKVSSSSLQLLNRNHLNVAGSKIPMSSAKFVFSSRSEKQDGRPDLLLAEAFSTFYLICNRRTEFNEILQEGHP